MSVAISTAQEAVLRCCANPESGPKQLLSLIDASADDEILGLTESTRVGPLLESCLRPASKAIMRPRLVDELARGARDQTLRALRQARGLVRAVQMLRDRGMEPIALKGAALAFRDFPSPQLRPLRDIDLLLPVEQAQAAHEFLLAQPGYRSPPWAARYGLDYGHQLPEIEDCEHGTIIEIHHRLNARGWLEEPQLLRAMESGTETIELLGVRIRVPSAELNLLHLVEHATLHHGFANGPLVLADLHFMATRSQLDWDSIECEAERLKLKRALLLVAGVALQFGAQWVPPALARQAGEARPFVAGAALAMFAEPEQVERHQQLRRLMRRSAGKRGPMAALLRMARPDRHQLAQFSGQSPDSLMRWTGYPAWLLAKGGQYLRSKRDPGFLAEHQQRQSMLDWLEHAPCR